MNDAILSQPFVLPRELTIYTAADTAQGLRAWLSEAGGPHALMVDGQGVGEVDGAGLQLLLALDRSCRARAQRWVIGQPSAALQQAFRMVGDVPEFLREIPNAGGAPC